MNKKPVWYLQIDKKWKNRRYGVPGENSTIGSAGCGPTSAAMIIASLADKKFTPVEACKYSLDHGYKSKGYGTKYAYFVPQFGEFGIKCQMLNWNNSYGNADHPNHAKAMDLLRKGYYLIALMKEGHWTKSGHFVVVWGVSGNTVYINDPASTRTDRNRANVRTFTREVKYYWVIDARKYNGFNTTPPPKPKPSPSNKPEINNKEENSMDMDEMRNDISSIDGSGNGCSEWAKKQTDWCRKKGIFRGNGHGDFGWKRPITREAFACAVYGIFKKLDMLDAIKDEDD